MDKNAKLFGMLCILAFLAACAPEETNTYATAEEHYAVGWLLHNVDENTPIDLDYSEKDFAVYNYSFNFPAAQPKHFSDVIAFAPPSHKKDDGIVADSVRLSLPLDRVFYLKAINPVPDKYKTGWSFSNHVQLNYLESDDPDEQGILNIFSNEYYLSDDVYSSIMPAAGDKKHIYFGKAPYTPASFIVDDSIRLNGNLLRGYNNDSYVFRPEEIREQETIVKFPQPEYHIFVNGNLKESKVMKNFNFKDLNYKIEEDGLYEIKLIIPTNYPVWNNTKIEASFNVPAPESQPPELQHIEANPYFIAGEEYDILVDLHDESGIEKVEMSAGTEFEQGGAAVVLVPELIDASKQVYAASFTPDGNFKEFNFGITATDANGNSITYVVDPIALPAQNLNFNLNAEKNIVSKGDKIKINGDCKTSNEAICDNFLIKYFINDIFVKTDATADSGKFSFEWEIPVIYDKEEANIAVKYAGTGIYLPHEEKLTFYVQTHDIDIGVFDLKTGKPTADKVIISANVRNLGFKDVQDIPIELRVDGSLAGEKKIPELKVKEEKLVEFEWLPKDEGSYEIEIEAKVMGDQNKNNDKIKEKSGISFIAPDITAFILSESVENVIIGSEPDVQFEIFNNGEETAEKIKAYLYDLYRPEFAFFSFLSGPAEEKPAEQPVEETPGEAETIEKDESEESPKPASGQPGGGGDSGGGGGGGGIPQPTPKKSPDKSEIIHNSIKYNLSAESHDTSIILNVATEQFEERLNFTDSDRIKQLQNNVYVYMSFFSDSYADFYLGDASKAVKDIGDLNPFELTSDKIKWKPKNAGNYGLVLFANATKDSNFDSNYYHTGVKVLRIGTNIEAAFSIDYNSEYIVGQESEITTKITNHGTADVENVKLTLFEQHFIEEEEIFKPKNKLIESINAGNLKQKETKDIKFKWKPSKPGENFLLLIAEAKGDINPEDNDNSAFFDVIPVLADVAAKFHYDTWSKIYSDDIFANEEQKLAAFIRNKGKSDANGVSLSLYEIVDRETRLVEKKDIGTLKPKQESDVEFSWTPSRNGRIELELEGIASNDENHENNNDSIIADVLVKDVDVKVTLESYPEFILANKNNPVGILVQNFGGEDAPGFVLELKANNVKSDSLSFKGLGSGKAEFIDLNWVPENDGNLEIKAEINLKDADLSNNNDTDSVKVFKTKDIRLGFVDKSGNNVERALRLGDHETLVDRPTAFTIPDTRLKMWIGDINSENAVAASIYSNTIVGNISITSAHLNEPVAQNGLLLYEIFANNDSWAYDAFSSFLARSVDTLDIRYTELEGFYCVDYNFSDNKCGEWKDVPLEILVSGGSLFSVIDTAKAAAIALGDKDYDNDNAPDWEDKDSDNDGIDDGEDRLTCFNGRLGSRETFNVTINESSDIGKDIKGKNKVGIRGKNKKVVEFDIDLSKDRLDCREVIVKKQPEATTRGFTLIKGISLTNETKTAYVDKIANFRRVCIKDEEVDSIDEMSQNCGGSNEFLVMCDGIRHGNYTCTDVGSQYKVEGLIHSAVAEPTSCQESWSCTEWSKCKDGKQTRTCTDTNSCGTSFNKPSGTKSCGEDVEHEEDEERSGKLSRNTFDLGEIKSWSDSKSRTLKLGVHDLVTFTFDSKLRSIEIEEIKGTRISIRISWSGKSIDLAAGETEAFDIDSDSKDDIKFTFETLSTDKAVIVIERTIEDARVSQPTRAAQPQQTTQEDVLRKGLEKAETPDVAAKPKEKGSIAAVITLVSFFAILSILIGVIIFKREEIMEFIGERTQEKETKPMSEYGKVKSYVLNELDRGYTLGQIKEKLESVGWQKELIDLVMRDIRRGK